MLFQELGEEPNWASLIPDYHVIYRPRSGGRRGGGVAILLHKILFANVPNSEERIQILDIPQGAVGLNAEFIVAKFNLGHRWFAAASLYCPPAACAKVNVKPILRATRGAPLLLTVDMNAQLDE